MDTSDSKRISHILLSYSFKHYFSRPKLREITGILLENPEGWEIVGRELLSVRKEDWERAGEEISRAEASGVRVINIFDSVYPTRLKAIPDPPAVIFLRGKLPEEGIDGGFLSLGIVGTRECTETGVGVAARFAAKLTALGGVIVSGMATGIDTAAHYGALNGFEKVKTSKTGECYPGVAVLGTGLLLLGAPERHNLAATIVENGGGIISEYAMTVRGSKESFPARNRIISGLSDAVLVVEAPLISGALITSRLALEQGREVFAVPGSVLSEASAGTNKLIREGAHAVTNLRELFEDLLPNPVAESYLKRIREKEPAKKPRKSKEQSQGSESPTIRASSIPEIFVNPEERALAHRVMTELSISGSRHFDFLVERLGTTASSLSGVLSVLEVGGALRRLEGDVFEATS